MKTISRISPLFVHDKALGEYYSIKDGAFEIYLDAGVYLNRFEIVFSQPETLSTSEFQTKENLLDIRFDYATKDIKIVNNSNVNIESVNMYSILGQSVYRSNTNSNNTVSISTSNITTGTYIVIINTENGIISKKILVN